MNLSGYDTQSNITDAAPAPSHNPRQINITSEGNTQKCPDKSPVKSRPTS